MEPGADDRVGLKRRHPYRGDGTGPETGAPFRQDCPIWIYAMQDANIVLIGMAAAGKSTVGRCLGKRLQRPFVDTDLLLEAWWGAPLQDITDHLGLEAFVQAEAAQILRLNLHRCVIATGGSVVYSEPAMAYLREIGHIVYLESSYENIALRLTNPLSRGLAIAPGQTIRDLYEERAPLYARFAQATINTDGISPDQACAAIIKDLPGILQELS